MTGFQVPRTIYRLEFEEPEFAGLVIKVRGTTLDELFALDAAQEAIGEAKGAKDAWDAIRARNTLFVEKITEWNLEDDGVPVPCTVDALSTMFDAPFANRMVTEWRKAASGVVAPPLGDSSSGGGQSPVESTLMDIPSESLAS